jgi:hypothetical protein
VSQTWLRSEEISRVGLTSKAGHAFLMTHDDQRGSATMRLGVLYLTFDASKTGILAKEAVGSNYRSTWSSSGAGMCS